MKAIITAGLFLALAGSAHGQVKARDLADSCKDYVNPPAKETRDSIVNSGICAGYITAFMDIMDGLDVYLDGKGVSVVFADGVSGDQVARVFLKHMTENPEVENKSAASQLLACLAKAKLVSMTPVKSVPDSNIQ